MTPSCPIARWLLTAAVAGVLAGVIPRPATAQAYTIGWSTLHAGGGPPTRLTGGTLSLGGTLGQPAAGPLTGGSFTLLGGFWGVPIGRLLDAETQPEVPLTPGRLTTARPNPFAVSTEVAFALAREGAVQLMIYDVTGHRVRTLLRGSILGKAMTSLETGTGLVLVLASLQ